jgi:hypothetical protein
MEDNDGRKGGKVVVQETMGSFPLTPEFVVSVVASAVALALEVVPGLKTRWEALPAEVKRFAWLVGCVLVGGAPWALGCLGGVLGLDLSALRIVGACEVDTLAEGMQIAFLAYFASQSVHGISVAGAKATSYLRARGEGATAV